MLLIDIIDFFYFSKVGTCSGLLGRMRHAASVLVTWLGTVMRRKIQCVILGYYFLLFHITKIKRTGFAFFLNPMCARNFIKV
jgi:hypothetical protein